METLLYLSSVCLLIIIGVYIIWSLRDQSEDMYYDLGVSKIESEIKRLEAEKANAYIEQLDTQLDVMGKRLSEYRKEAKGYESSFEAAKAVNKELREQIKSLQSEIDEWKHVAKALHLTHAREKQSLYGRIGKMTQTINNLKK